MLAFHLVLPTLVTMIFPKRGKFNVTDKGGCLTSATSISPWCARTWWWPACWPWGWWSASSGRLAMTTLARIPTLSPSTSGGIYSLIFLLAAIAVARETRQVRKTIRIDVDIPVVIHYASGIVSRSHTADLSMGGCRVVAPDNRHLEDDIEEIELILQSGAISIPAQLVTSDERFLRLKFDEDIPLSRRRELVRVVLARADAWINPPRPQDNPAPSSPFYAACSNCSG